MMEAKAHYTIVGLFVVLLSLLLIVVVLWLTSLKHNKVYDTYISNMREEVSGLSVQSAVRYNGVKVGYVSAINLNPHDPQQVTITMKVEEGTPITTSTVATLMSEGITGIAYVGLKALTSAAPLLVAKAGQRYPEIPSRPSLLLKLSTSIQKVTESVTRLSNNVALMFDKKNRRSITNILTNLDDITTNLQANAQNINASIASAKSLLHNSAQASLKLPALMSQLQQTLAAVKKAAHSFNQTGQSITQTMQATRRGINNASQQLMPSAQRLLLRLNSVVANLQALSAELQNNPSILIRGKTPQLPGPGEK